MRKNLMDKQSADYKSLLGGALTGAGTMALIRALGLAHGYIGDKLAPKSNLENIDIFYDKTKKKRKDGKEARASFNSGLDFEKDAGIKDILSKLWHGKARSKFLSNTGKGGLKDAVSQASKLYSKGGNDAARDALTSLRGKSVPGTGLASWLKKKWHGKASDLGTVAPEVLSLQRMVGDKINHVPGGISAHTTPLIAAGTLGGILSYDKIKQGLGGSGDNPFSFSDEGLGAGFWTGLGLIPGLYGMHKAIQTGEKWYQDKQFTDKTQEIEDAIYESTRKRKEEDDSEGKLVMASVASRRNISNQDIHQYKAKVVKAYTDGFNVELAKQAALNPRIQKRSQVISNLVRKEASIPIEKTAGMFSTATNLLSKYPALIGALIPTGFLAGLHTTKYMFPDKKVHIKPKEHFISEQNLTKSMNKIKAKKKKDEEKKQKKLQLMNKKSNLAEIVKYASVAHSLESLFNEEYASEFLKQAEEESGIMSALDRALPYLIGGGTAALGVAGINRIINPVAPKVMMTPMAQMAQMAPPPSVSQSPPELTQEGIDAQQEIFNTQQEQSAEEENEDE